MLKSFLKSRDGAAGVEAGLLLPIFIPMLIYSFELLMFVYSSQELDQALQRTVQELRLGEAEGTAGKNGWTAKQYYKKAICEQMLMPTCEEDIKVEVEQFDDDANSTGTFDDAFTSSSTLVQIRVELPVSFAFLMSTLPGHNPTIASSMAVMTEPY